MTPAITNANAYDARAYARAASLQRWPEVLAPFGEGGGFSLGDQAIETSRRSFLRIFQCSFQQFIADAALLISKIWFRPLFAEGNL
jgi:hypothetical protein